MKNIPTLKNVILETILKNSTLTNEELDAILNCEKTTLMQDLHSIIKFCDNDLDETEDEISYNLLFFTLFLLKEIETENQLEMILSILKWDEGKIEYWFGDLFTEYYWCLVCHFGEHQIETLVGFLKQEGVATFCKEQVALAIYQLYRKQTEKQDEISKYWTELLEFYNNIFEDSENIDYTYLAFFVSYVFQPNDYQKELIKGLYDKGYIDLSINGYYEELYDIIEAERKVLSIFDVNNDFIEFDNGQNSDYNSKIFEDLKQYKKNDSTIVYEKKVNRNDPCPCGSGEKFKKCCL